MDVRSATPLNNIEALETLAQSDVPKDRLQGMI